MLWRCFRSCSSGWAKRGEPARSKRSIGMACRTTTGYRDPKGLPNLDALQSNVDQQQQLGFLKSKVTVKNYVDLSLVQEAAKRLN